MSVKVWSDVVGCWNAKGAVDDGALEELLPAGVDGLGRRDALWAVMDKNGGGSLSLPEIDGWFTRETLAREERGGFKLKGGQRKSTLAQYAKPCLIRSFYRANSASGSSDRSDNKVVTRDEFRFFCHCFGCALRLSLVLERGNDWKTSGVERTVSRASWTAALSDVNAVLRAQGHTADASEASFGPDAGPQKGASMSLQLDFFARTIFRKSIHPTRPRRETITEGIPTRTELVKPESGAPETREIRRAFKGETFAPVCCPGQTTR